MALIPACVWRITDELVIALDQRFGEPVDSYVNGSQTWLRPDGPGDAVLEWRLHPVAGYRRPDGLATPEVFAAVAFALANGDPPPVPAADLWDGLEAFPARGDDIEPAPLAAAATEALGIAPDAAGLVDHDTVADTWERAKGNFAIIPALLDQLS